MLPELARLDLATLLPRIETPVVLVQGRPDEVASGRSTRRYVATLEAPCKALVCSRARHTCHTLEEPRAFKELLGRVREGHAALPR